MQGLRLQVRASGEQDLEEKRVEEPSDRGPRPVSGSWNPVEGACPLCRGPRSSGYPRDDGSLRRLPTAGFPGPMQPLPWTARSGRSTQMSLSPHATSHTHLPCILLPSTVTWEAIWPTTAASWGQRLMAPSHTQNQARPFEFSHQKRWMKKLSLKRPFWHASKITPRGWMPLLFWSQGSRSSQAKRRLSRPGLVREQTLGWICSRQSTSTLHEQKQLPMWLGKCRTCRLEPKWTCTGLKPLHSLFGFGQSNLPEGNSPKLSPSYLTTRWGELTQQGLSPLTYLVFGVRQHGLLSV